MKTLFVLLCLLSSNIFAGVDIPNSAIRTTNLKSICTTLTGTIRNVPHSMKDKIFIRDNGDLNHRGYYEVDHRIALSSGGSNDISNLTLQSYGGKCNAHDKDKLEVRLHALICNQKIQVSDAQDYLYNHWQDGYKQFINPLGCEQ